MGFIKELERLLDELFNSLFNETNSAVSGITGMDYDSEKSEVQDRIEVKDASRK